MESPYLLYHLVLILIFSGGLGSDFIAKGGADAMRIPEHSCHKLVQLSNCNNQKCLQECSKHPYATGHCKDSTCSCTFYCKDPPLPL